MSSVIVRSRSSRRRKSWPFFNWNYSCSLIRALDLSTAWCKSLFWMTKVSVFALISEYSASFSWKHYFSKPRASSTRSWFSSLRTLLLPSNQSSLTLLCWVSATCLILLFFCLYLSVALLSFDMIPSHLSSKDLSNSKGTYLPFVPALVSI